MDKIKHASKLHRIFAAVMDILIAVVFASLISLLIINPIFVNSAPYKENYSVYENGLLSTQLYQKDENNSSKLTCVIDLLNSDGSVMFSVDKINDYDNNLISFYSNYSSEKVEEYQNTKETSNIYIKNELNEYVLVESVDINEAYSFFSTSYINATKYFFSQNESVNDAYYFLSLTSRYSTIIPIGISLLLCYILMPLILKDGQTIAKKLFSLKVISLKEDKQLTKGQIVLRGLFFVFVELVLSYFMYFIPVVISILFLLINKNHLSLHDYIGQTSVIDALSGEQTRDNVIDVEVKEL